MPSRQAPHGGHAGVEGLQRAGDGEQGQAGRVQQQDDAAQAGQLRVRSRRRASEVTAATDGVAPVVEGERRDAVDRPGRGGCRRRGRRRSRRSTTPKRSRRLTTAADAPEAAKTATPSRSASSRAVADCTAAGYDSCRAWRVVEALVVLEDLLALRADREAARVARGHQTLPHSALTGVPMTMASMILSRSRVVREPLVVALLVRRLDADARGSVPLVSGPIGLVTASSLPGPPRSSHPATRTVISVTDVRDRLRRRRWPTPCAAGRPVVALESTIVAHGLPRPDNLRVAREIEQTVRAAGAVPATIGMLGGRLIVGLDDAQLTRLATADGVAKLSVRDLAVGRRGRRRRRHHGRRDQRGRRRGRHRGLRHRRAGRRAPRRARTTSRPTWSRWPVRRSRWSAPGVKSILDVGATLERLETLGVAVVGYRHPPLPRLLPHRQRLRPGLVGWTRPEQVAAALRRPAAQGVHAGALVVANPLPVDEQLDPDLHDRVLADGHGRCWSARASPARRSRRSCSAHFHEATGGASLAVNVRIILRNADLAARIAAAAASTGDGPARMTRIGRRRRRRGHRRAGGARRTAGAGHGHPGRDPRSPAAARRRTPRPGWPGTGVAVTLVAAVGADEAGAARLAELRAAGVRLPGAAAPGRRRPARSIVLAQRRATARCSPTGAPTCC